MKTQANNEMRTCPFCKAYYRVGRWYSGYYQEGTSGAFVKTGRIPENKCPVCRKEHPE